MWSIGILNSYKSQCGKCNSSSQEDPHLSKHSVERQESSTTLTEGSKEEEHTQQTNHSSTMTTTSSSSHKSCICSEFDDLLEQSFYCSFGFRKKSAKYLKTHSVLKQPYDLHSAQLIYAHFKPARLPEYDDRVSSSISAEVGSTPQQIHSSTRHFHSYFYSSKSSMSS